jgi:DNA-binding NarL/FixJ family response regulator
MVLGDDHAVVREGIRRVLSESPVEVIGEGATGTEVLQLVRRLKPDVVLLDIRMPGMDGLTALREIKRETPDTPVIMLTAYDEPAWLVQAIAHGAAGYLLKSMPKEDLAAAIVAVVNGDSLVNPARLTEVIRRLASETAEPPSPLTGEASNLTARETEVLALMTEGLTNQQIAEVLSVAPSTIKSHVQNVILKLGASDRTQAAVIGVKAGLVRRPAR